MTSDHALQRLHDAGVSIWLDTLSRELLDSGAFAALIADCAVTGATSNPTIFAKAITGSDRYDEQLRAAVAAGVRDTQELFFALALDDVVAAADLLRPAYDAQRRARRVHLVRVHARSRRRHRGAPSRRRSTLWERLGAAQRDDQGSRDAGRGRRAIEELTARGVNVNVTLLFSVARYEQVIDAYLRGLSAASPAGEPLDAIASVASFFVSRIDTKADALLAPDSAAARPRGDRQRAPSPTGATCERFAGERWQRAAPPRAPAPAAAVGEHRNQEPRLLRRALRRGADRARRRQHDARGHAARLRRPRRRSPRRSRASPPRPRQVLRDAAARRASTWPRSPRELEREGVQSFCDSYQQLLDCIESKTATHHPRDLGHAMNLSHAPRLRRLSIPAILLAVLASGTLAVGSAGRARRPRGRLAPTRTRPRRIR